MAIIIKNLEYTHSNKEILFSGLNLTVNDGDKIALMGNNGCGKSTLMQLISGQLHPTCGTVSSCGKLYYVPQHFGQYNHCTIAQALKIDRKLHALHHILNGDAAEQWFTLLNDDWNIEEQARAALALWGFNNLPLSHSIDKLSGGEKTRIFLAGIELHQPDVWLLDEPTNHLDTLGRKRLYALIRQTKATVLLVSHDRTLLNLLPTVCELHRNGLSLYGGNYDFYKEQKEIFQTALQQQIEEKQKALRLARQKAREVEERKNKLNTRGSKASAQKGIPRIALNTLRNRAESSTNRLKSIHNEKLQQIQQEMNNIRSALSITAQLKTDFAKSALHTGKILVSAEKINYHYPNAKSAALPQTIDLIIRSGDRLCIKGNNGSGKTTLLKLIVGELLPTEGLLKRADFTYIYLDQEYSLIDNNRSILQQAQYFNSNNLPQHEVNTILNRYLFAHDVWSKLCGKLSGGEKMRLAFCCLMIAQSTPDLFVLDEPTNNLDMESIEIITTTIAQYDGTVIVVSHDEKFIHDIRAEKEISLFRTESSSGR